METRLNIDNGYRWGIGHGGGIGSGCGRQECYGDGDSSGYGVGVNNGCDLIAF